MSVSSFSGRLEISLGAVAANYRFLRGQTRTNVAAVVKADAYGLGADPVFQTLIGEGCTSFFVATPDEGAALRAQNDTAQIYVLGGILPGMEDIYIRHALIPVLNTNQMLHCWNDTARNVKRNLPCALHFDTGMNRLGLDVSESLGDTDGLDIRLVMSHLACAEMRGHPMNERQAALFKTIAARFPGVPASLCNSSGIFAGPAWHHDMVRPGYALYGGNPVPGQGNPMKPVVRLGVRVLQIRTARAGESAGYDATYVFDRDTKIAILAAGYADGLPRAGSNRAALFWNGHPCPVRGRVSMDLTAVDISGAQGPAPEEGDFLDLIGPDQDIGALAESCATIGYEVLTRAGRRYERVYT